MGKVINNDFHPDDKLDNDADHGHWGEIDNSIDLSTGEEGPYSLGQTMSSKRAEKDTEEKISGTRFHDSGARIPGKQKGLNDKNRDRPARLSPMINRSWDQ